MTTRRQGPETTHPRHQADGTAIESTMSGDVVNIPENVIVAGISSYAEKDQDNLLWLSGWITDSGKTRSEICDLLTCDWTTVTRVMTGKYEASIANFMKKVRDLRRRVSESAATGFVETIVTRRICDHLDYALAGDIRGGKMVIISGPTGRSKTGAVRHWCHGNNHGRSCYIDSPESGGYHTFLYEVCRRFRINTGRKTADMRDRVFKAFNRRRILVLDEANRLMPGSHQNIPRIFEFVRRLRDLRRCAVAVIINPAAYNNMTSGAMAGYFEQFLGRSDPLIIPDKVFRAEAEAICSAFVSRPARPLVDLALAIANEPGRLRVLFDLLAKAKLLSDHKDAKLSVEHLQTAHQRRQNINIWPEE